MHALEPPTTHQGWWPRLQEFIKKWWGIGLAVFGAIGALTKYVSEIDAERHARERAIDAAISALQHDTTPAGRRRTLDSLGSAGLAEHLEPRAINGLQNFIKSNTHRATACTPNRPRDAVATAQHADVNHAFRLVAGFEAPAHGHHSYPDRVIDAILVWWHGERPANVDPLDVSGSDLRGDNLSDVRLRAASFVGACLIGTDFRRAILTGARFDHALLNEALFDMAAIDSADFTQAFARSTSFAGARGTNVTFSRTDLSDANFNGAMLSNARFFGANLSCATLGNAHLQNGYFSSVTARWTFFGGADLTGATKWEEISDFKGAYIASIRGLPPASIELMQARGAVPDTTNQARWSDIRLSQLRPSGACRP